MLEQLSLQNIGGVSRSSLAFDSSFVVITGESGAGKSSIVRAMELVAGKRGQVALIRAGEDEAAAEAVFLTDAVLPDLSEDLQPAEGAFFAKRTLSRNGRGRATLQGTQLPLNLYGAAVSRLIHIQSQFAQMELLDTDRQLVMVDSCGGDELRADLAELKDVFERARAKERELRGIAERRAEIERLYANAAEVVPLVKKVAPEPGLEASLEREIAELSRRLSERAKLSQNLDLLTGGLSERGLLDELENICTTLLECIPQEDAAECLPMLQDGMQHFRDIAQIAGGVSGDSPSVLTQEIDQLEERLGSLRKLRRMAGARTEEELLSYCRGATEGMAWLGESYERLEVLNGEARELRRQASKLAIRIRGMRRRAAEELEKRVNLMFKDLAMDGIGFSIRFIEHLKLRINGADGVEFMLFTDKRSGRVDKIASGGELSRLLLALQLSLPDEWLPSTLVFDEVEAGLGGRAAVLSGLKLKELSRKCQVMLVTHEASIAALGTEHYVVRKEAGESLVFKVTDEERVRELARMLSGDSELAEAQEHARRLLRENN